MCSTYVHVHATNYMEMYLSSCFYSLAEQNLNKIKCLFERSIDFFFQQVCFRLPSCLSWVESRPSSPTGTTAFQSDLQGVRHCAMFLHVLMRVVPSECKMLTSGDRVFISLHSAHECTFKGSMYFL